MNSNEFIDYLHEKIFTIVPKLEGAVTDEDIRAQIKALCIELAVVDHNRPDNLPNDVVSLVVKAKKCCSAPGIGEINLSVEISDSTQIQKCKNCFLSLWEKLEQYRGG